MAEIDTTSKIGDLLLERITSQLNETTAEKIEKLRQQKNSLPSVMDYDTLSKLRNGQYDITLKEYTSMSTYDTMMNALYGNKSADPFQQKIDSLFGYNNLDTSASVKDFIDKMRERGVSNSNAIKMYSAFKKYSLVSGFKNYNFVNAKI